MKDLTPVQREILLFIKQRCQIEGAPPSYREIQEHFGYGAVGTVQDHVGALRKKGYLEKSKTGKGRTARGLFPKGHRRVGAKAVPIYGEIAAGATRDANQLEMGELLVPDEISEEPSFALRVVGNSMVDAGIFEGDLLIVERGHRIREGEIIVALVDGETTVKRYSKKEGRIQLVPENRFMKPIVIRNQNFEIQGKVVGLQRKI